MMWPGMPVSSGPTFFAGTSLFHLLGYVAVLQHRADLARGHRNQPRGDLARSRHDHRCTTSSWVGGRNHGYVGRCYLVTLIINIANVHRQVSTADPAQHA